ncbi:M16 family metallopeptidase [Saccharospirillum impatiens]|uniref:M16 family metallopeptidase n=1 Tax=Saccharospirillum impatiens TaxID=169438 RepID=UPI00146F2EDE|nr:M16 family metallopeptidase [Saccharospirillum impatiens]
MLLLAVITLAGCALTAKTPEPVVNSEPGRPELYIWPNSNSHSNNEAYIRLLVKAGSLQEEDSELGYAHFVEHMAFNGTTAFPGEAVRDQLEYLGMSLGNHSNAYTTFDHTSYELYLNSVDPERLEAAIQLLAEWAYHIEFSEQEVQKEKAVIVEEWRLSETEADRVDARMQDNYLSGSRLAERMPIGTRQSVGAATADGLKTFYQRWYRANNMAIVIAGDVDEDLVSGLVSQYFPEDTRRSPEPGTYLINPAAMEDRLILTDPYAASGYIGFDYYADYQAAQTPDDVLAMQHWNAALDIWYDRVQARLPETEGAVVNADYYWETISPDTLGISLSAQLSSDDFEQAIRIIEGERQRIITSGISQSELDDWRNSVLEHERSQQDAAGHLAGVIYDHILNGWPLLGQPERITLYEDRLDELTPQSVQAAFTALFNTDPKVTLVHPYRSPAPTTDDIDTWLANVDVLPHVQAKAAQGETLWTINPATAGAIVNEENLPEEVTRWTLDNGMTVYYRHSDQAPGKVYYELHGLQGLNALSPAETAVARLALPALGTSGLRDMNGAQLSEWLNARAITQVPTFSFFDRGMYGSGPSQQFPIMMRLLHVALTEAQVDEAAWRHIRNQNREHLEQWKGHPHEPWYSLVEEALFNSDVALRTLTTDELERIDTEDIQAFYDTYYAGTQNYRISIVGDISKELARASVLEAVATLPRQSADWATVRPYPSPQASASHTVTDSGEQTATAILRYSLPKSETPETSFKTLSLLEDWINNALFEDIRENKGRVYSINSVIDGATVSQTEFTLIVELATDPENVEAVVTEVKARLQSLAETPATESQITQWHETMEQDFQQYINAAEQQAEALAYAPLFGQDPIAALTFDSEPPAAPNQLVELAAQFTHPETTLIELIWMP